MLLLVSLLPFVSRFVCVNASPTVQLGDTTLIGREIASFEQEFFGNIPYADPPLADLRFKAPVAKSSLAPGPFNATKYGLPASNQMSEDGLTINVLRPAGVSAEAKLPVVSFLSLDEHGGGFGTPIIFVNFNYRLGPLGFPRGQEAGDRGDVNLGIKDVIAALQWVQHNIESFGGNKDKVTLFSQSAGSVITSILFLNSAPFASMRSSQRRGTTPLFPPARDEVDWETFVSGVPSCSDLATSGSTFDCLAQANTTEIFQGFTLVTAESTTLTPWPPVLDGPGGLIPDLPSALFDRGQFARLPFIAGTVLDEGTTWVAETINSTEEIYDSILSLFSPSSSLTTLADSAQTLLELQAPPFGTGNDTFGLSSQFKCAAALNSVFGSQRRFWMDTAADAGVKTFGYLFTQPQAIPSVIGELVYIFGKPNDTSAQTEELSRIMTDYWVSFVTSLTPNDGLGVPRPEWTQFTPENRTLIQLNGLNLTMIPDNYRAEQIAFFNSDPAIWRR
ncbi:esterase 1 [Mycena galopus ATCC 62051]|nr:esterase 1 [Mycena galopus ATCC 62051]